MAEHSRQPIDPAAALAPLTRLAHHVADGPDDEAEMARGREALLASLDRSASVIPLARRPSWLLVAAMLGALLIAGFFAWPRRALDYAIDGSPVAERYVFAGPRGASVRFSEGTEIRFDAGSHGRIAEVTARGARLNIEAGRAHFRVMHLPGAAWVAEAGPFAIAVTGTEFDVTWRDERLEVEVRVGSVVVSGPLAPSGVPLGAGQRLVADVGRAELTLSAIAGAEAPPAPVAAEIAHSDSDHAHSQEAPSSPPPRASSALPPASTHVEPWTPATPAPIAWRTRVASGDFAGVLADAEARGLDVSLDQTPLSELAALADAARYAGRGDLAKRALLAERSRFAGSAEAHSAAFLLGRMAESGSRAAAVDWYDHYLGESPSGALASEALGRKMLLLKSTSRDAARPAAEEYLRRFPNGALRAAADEILTPAPPPSATPAP